MKGAKKFIERYREKRLVLSPLVHEHSLFFNFSSDKLSH